MNKQELALQYFPDATSATAVRHLTRWIARCHPLGSASTWASHPPHPDPIPKEIFP